MALTQVYTAIAGHIITAARWNNEFGNIYTNGVDLAFPLTKAVSVGGYTVTLDVAGVTTLTSTSSTGFVFTVGAKSGTPSVNGSSAVFTAMTYTDTNTAGSGTCALWTGVSLRTPTLAAANLSVTTTDACTLYVEAGPTAGTNETLTNRWAIYTPGSVYIGGDIRQRTEGTHTNSILLPMTVQSTTSGSPAAGIGTGIAFFSESADEVPCAVGSASFALSDVASGSEDSYFEIAMRAAGAAISKAYRFVRTNAFNAIFTHANTADRTYTLQNRTGTLAHAPIIEFLTSGTSWAVPTGVTVVDVEIFGASGGGGGGGESLSNAGGAGTAGGTTSFNSGALSTTGGTGGFGGTGGATLIAGATGVAHGVGSGGTVNRTGGGQSGGRGGEAGTAAASTGCNGGQGGDGGYVRAALSVTPGASIAYAIGAAGALGAGGTGTAEADGGAGTDGQAGVIVLVY